MKDVNSTHRTGSLRGKIDCLAEFIPGRVLIVAGQENPNQQDPLLKIIGPGVDGLASNLLCARSRDS